MFAVDLYGTAVERAYAKASADESADRERAAVHRFSDRTGLIALKDAVSAFPVVVTATLAPMLS